MDIIEQMRQALIYSGLPESTVREMGVEQLAYACNNNNINIQFFINKPIEIVNNPEPKQEEQTPVEENKTEEPKQKEQAPIVENKADEPQQEEQAPFVENKTEEP